MPLERLRKYLDEHHVTYKLITHPETYTAQQTAEAAHIPNKELAKTVIVSIDDQWAMVVLPASEKLDLARLRAFVGTSNVHLANEDDMTMLFTDCEVGAMPPLGNLYGMPVFVDHHLREDTQIAFNAGNHRELIYMPYKDFERLVDPVVAPICA